MKQIFILVFLFFSHIAIWAQGSEKMYLTGKDAHHTVNWDFFCSAGQNSQKWRTIALPSCWEQQGFGSYNYGTVDFKDRLKETGHYKRSFKVPKNWENKVVKIVFEGVMTDAQVKINGQLAGAVHQGAFYEFEYNISHLLKYGKNNNIEVFVKKHSDNESINYAERKSDYWVFGGIFRPVYLEAKPKYHISHVAIDANAKGDFKADVYTSDLPKNAVLEVDILTSTGQKITSFKTDTKGTKTSINGTVAAVERWNPEQPTLYKALFKLSMPNGKNYIHTEKFGFRTVEVRESDGIYVNGVKIKFKGVNRHTFHPDYARTSSKKLSIEAVKLMKEMNMNAVRMSHYPPEKHFLDVCDSMGLFVIDELAGWQRPAYDEVAGRKLLKEMLKRDVNHPSIILWSNGNEGGWNNALNDDFEKLDIQKRKLIHAWENFRETNTIHYVGYNYLALDGYGKRKIFFPTELLHGLYDGGHGAGLNDYWKRLWEHPLSAGTFLWVFADEGIARTDRNGAIDVDGNHAPDGILGPYLEKEASFYTIKKIWSPIFFEKKYIGTHFDGQFNIENRYHYTNLDQCVFDVQWIAYDLKNKEIIKAQESIKLPLLPRQRGQLRIKLPAGWKTFHTLKIIARNAENPEIATWTYPIQLAEQFTENLLDVTNSEERISLTETNQDYLARVGTLEYTFEKSTGILQEVKKNNKVIPLNNGPVFVSRDQKIKEVNARQEADGTVSISSIYEKGDSCVWKIYQDGRLGLSVAYEPINNAAYAGVSFSFPENVVKGIRWMGDGPHRVWKNRMLGNNFGIWEKQHNKTMTGLGKLDYPEFKGYHANLYWAEIQTESGLNFKVYAKSNDIFLRLLTPDFPEDGRSTIVPFPKGDISFLHGINATGTKFKSIEDLGPESAPYAFHRNNYYLYKLKMELLFEF